MTTPVEFDAAGACNQTMLVRLKHQYWHPIALVISAPFLLFPGVFPRLTAAVMLLLVATWVAELVNGADRTISTPLLWPWLALFVATLIGTWKSPEWQVTLPKITGVVLGMFVMRFLLLRATTRSRIWLAVGLYLLVGTALMTFGSFGTFWLWKSKTPVLSWVTDRIPHLFDALPGAEQGVNPNALGGTTLFLIPLLTSLITWLYGKRDRLDVSSGQTLLIRVIVLLMLLEGVGLLVLSQSRTCWVAGIGTVGWVLAVALRDRPRWWLVIASVPAIIVVIIVSGRSALEHPALGSGPEVYRPEIWAKGISDVAASPLTGIGLGFFRRTIYVPPRPPGPHGDVDIAHSHNVFLQMALDVGIPGLIAYVSLLLLAIMMCMQVYRLSDHAEQALSLGLFGNLLAIHIFGLTDAIALGAKVGLLFWWSLGLLGALHQYTFQSRAFRSIGPLS
jgi:O-antigen ligase/polysaccharide polymerase Wzy-like membrane protein